MPNPDRPSSSGNDSKPSGSPPPSRGRPDKGSGSNLVWYILGVAAVVLLANMWFAQRNGATELKFRDFVSELEKSKATLEKAKTANEENLHFEGKYHRDNVYEL